MAEQTVQVLTSTRRLQRIAATNLAAATGPALSLTQPSGAGIFNVADYTNQALEAHVGGPRRVKFIPCSTTNNGYTLKVYGWSRAGAGDIGTDAWVPMLLYKGTMATPVASSSPGSGGTWVDSTDYFITGVTNDAAVPAASVQIYPCGLNGLASYVLIDCMGCPLIQFDSTRADSFVLAAQVA